MKIIPAYARASSSFIALMLFGADGDFPLRPSRSYKLKSSACYLL